MTIEEKNAQSFCIGFSNAARELESNAEMEERVTKSNPNDPEGDLYEKGQYYGFNDGYVQGATDQDPISRADERKKVIEKACEYLKEYCYDN